MNGADPDQDRYHRESPPIPVRLAKQTRFDNQNQGDDLLHRRVRPSHPVPGRYHGIRTRTASLDNSEHRRRHLHQLLPEPSLGQERLVAPGYLAVAERALQLSTIHKPTRMGFPRYLRHTIRHMRPYQPEPRSGIWVWSDVPEFQVPAGHPAHRQSSKGPRDPGFLRIAVADRNY